MAEPYRIVVGLEVHVQLLTKTKLFCGCSTQFGQPPNSATCPVCLGLPGVLPVMNAKAYDLSLRAALAVNCSIARFTKWDRKNYYYPDLPKNYQVSQYDLPMSHDGWLEINAANDPKKEFVSKKIGIIRAHLEEDAGKSTHDESGRGGDSKVDLNRTGTPLLEIVSHPEISTAREAGDYLRELRLLLRELKISDCEMQEGSLRCDANINIHVLDDKGEVVGKTPIVEVKNLNSIGSVERSIDYEAVRHYEQYKADKNWRFGVFSKETRGWNDAKGSTTVQRRKEEAADYRYFPEPDLVPVVVSDEQLAKVRSEMGELPSAQRVRLQQAPYSLSAYDAGVLTAQGRSIVAYFEAVVKSSNDAKASSNWVTNEVLASLKERDEAIEQFPIQADRLAGMITEITKTGMNKNNARAVYKHLLENNVDAATAAKALGIEVMADTSKLLEIVLKAIDANPKAVTDFKNGKVKAADAIKGAVMRETKGSANTEIVQQLVMQELAKK